MKKRWLQGLGLVYVFLLLGAYIPQNLTETGEPDAGEVVFISGESREKQEEERAEAEKAGTEEKEVGAEAEKAGTKEEIDAEAKKAGTEAKVGAEAEKTEQPKIALTFDDGPHAKYTPALLDGLKERGVNATFFLIGENIEQGDNTEIVKREWEEGHLVGNHTYHHVEITRVSDETAYQEIVKTNELITAVTGEPVEYMRPPFGLWQKNLEQRIHVLPVMWTIDPLDWATENVDEIVNKVVTDAEENDIILLHDCYNSSVKAALRIVDLLQAEGFQFVTVDELIAE